MSKPSAPAPPDPTETAAASTGTNVGTAIANTTMGQVDQYGPTGSLTYDQTGTSSYTDPYTGQTYDIPSYSATTSLTPEEQSIFDVNQASRYGMGDLANNQINFLGDYLGESTPEAPQLGQFDPTNNSYIRPEDAGNIQTSVGDAGDITKTYGGDFSEDRQRVEDALMARMQPYLDKQREQMDQKLANQGIVAGSEAYSRDVDAYGQRANDATYGAILAGGQEQSRLNDMEARRAGFENAAQMQQYGQNYQSGMFANQAQQQQYGQGLQSGMFANQAQNQQFGQNAQLAGGENAFNQQDWMNQYNTMQANNATMGSQYQMDMASRNQPINEITALLSGSQVSSPNFQMSMPSPIATTDTAGLINQNYNQQYGNYQDQMGQWNNTMGGLFGLATGFM